MRTFVVTGGAGFIGSHITEALVSRGDRVRVIDNLVSGHLTNLREVINEIEFIEADVCDSDTLRTAFQGVDCVLHQAALASVPLSLDQPQEVHRACVTGTLTVLDEARKADVRRVVFASSSACYGDQAFAANRESDPLMAISPYAAAKVAGEFYCQAFHGSYGLETVCLRYFNVFGPRQDPNSHYAAAIPKFITQLLSGQPPTIYDDGHQSRDFCFVRNIADANLLAIDAPNVAGKSFNVASGQATTVVEVVELLQSLLEIDTEPQFHPPRPGDIRHSLADITRATQALGFRPKIDFRAGLQQSIEYYRSLYRQPI